MPELVGFVVPGMVGMGEAGLWAGELESVFARGAGRFSRVDLRWRMRDYVRGLLAVWSGRTAGSSPSMQVTGDRLVSSIC
ncbi:hypothetical protein GCM10012287_10080 [Streptomyces daqingensis]|uniref:Uncharacterized protein n=1 Tax=Streptomyces daqingensis TaxID=1472640 RepID=A0ABQ2LY14_9ACTN|nr:hypothetical protein GCM10012287_10080 [Streptomyces daqingensis]